MDCDQNQSRLDPGWDGLADAGPSGNQLLPWGLTENPTYWGELRQSVANQCTRPLSAELPPLGAGGASGTLQLCTDLEARDPEHGRVAAETV